MVDSEEGLQVRSSGAMGKIKAFFRRIGTGLSVIWGKMSFGFLKEPKARKITLGVMLLLLLTMFGFMWYWSREPKMFDPLEEAKLRSNGQTLVTGSVTTTSLIKVTETLLDKPGGYLSNDIMPPWVILDNMPSWEFGALVQIRDLARTMRNDFARSRSQSVENTALAEGEPLMNFNNSSWVFPATESEYRRAIEAFDEYRVALAASQDPNTQFYARADNLREWLGLVEKRLGSLSQRLSASVGQVRNNTDLAGDSSAQQATQSPSLVQAKTPRLQIDNVFFEARGATWALIHFLRAVEIDFEDVLKNKNAEALVAQIIRELEGTQKPLRSPMILNGRGYGFFANHSLVMAAYVSRANAAIIELRDMLSQG